MPIQSGDFTASQLAETLIRQDAMWTDDMINADFIAQTEVYNALRKEQNANVSILQDAEKDRDVKIFWVNACGEAVEDDDGNDCDLAGNQLGSDSKTYSLTTEKSWKFTVDEMSFRNQEISMEEVVAKGLLKGDKLLSEAISASAVSAIESFKGVNAVTDGVGTVNALTTQTDVPAADWNSRLFAYLYRVGIQNQFSNPFLLSGSNLYEDYIVAQQSQANADGKGNANLYNMMRKYFDLFNIDTANSPDAKSYMINRGSVAFASKAYYGSVPIVYNGAGQSRYSIPSRNLEGTRYDIFYTNRCTGSTVMHDFKMKAKYDYFLNPTGCDGTRTGILGFNKV